ncbi:MAG: PIN domain-containing protein [Acidimicrobiales bacterium]
MVDHIEGAGFEPLAISAAHAERAGALPPYHRDPFDRMLVGQAQVEALAVVTRDLRSTTTGWTCCRVDRSGSSGHRRGMLLT